MATITITVTSSRSSVQDVTIENDSGSDVWYSDEETRARIQSQLIAALAAVKAALDA